MEASPRFKTDGEALNGTWKAGGSTAVNGTVKGKTINFVLNVTTRRATRDSDDREVDGDRSRARGTFGQGTGVDRQAGRSSVDVSRPPADARPARSLLR